MKKPKAKRRQPERALHKQVADYLDLALTGESFWFPVPNGPKLSAITAAMLKRTKQIKAGVPDICIISRGGAYFIELKAPKGRATASQWSAATLLASAGADVMMCDSLDKVRDALAWWKIPVRAR